MTSPNKYPQILTVPGNYFCQFPLCELNRNNISIIEKRKKHFISLENAGKLSDNFTIVSVAVLMPKGYSQASYDKLLDPTRPKWIIDGNYRAILWKNGHLSMPDYVTVFVYSVTNIDEASDLYRSFDKSYV